MLGELAMSASNETMPPPPEEMAKVWEIHKDADATLHSRVNVFVSTQAFLFAGFAAFLALDLEENIRNHLLLVVLVVGLISALVFMYSQNRILTGIEYLKNQYLLEHDKIYSDYYWGERKGTEACVYQSQASQIQGCARCSLGVSVALGGGVRFWRRKHCYAILGLPWLQSRKGKRTRLRLVNICVHKSQPVCRARGMARGYRLSHPPDILR